jgi:hypothetical protein
MRCADVCCWPLSTFVATRHFGSYRSNSGRAADIEPTLMTQRGNPSQTSGKGIFVSAHELSIRSSFGAVERSKDPEFREQTDR